MYDVYHKSTIINWSISEFRTFAAWSPCGSLMASWCSCASHAHHAFSVARQAAPARTNAERSSEPGGTREWKR